MSPEVAASVRSWGVDTSAPAALLGGDDSEVWRRGPHVVRVHPPDAPVVEVRWCQAWAAAVGAQVPEVLRPLASEVGTTLTVLAGRAVEVVPFVAGEHLDAARGPWPDPAAASRAAEAFQALR